MAEQSDIQSLIQMLGDRMDRQDARSERQDARLERQEAQQQTTNDLLLRLLNQQEATFGLHQNFQKHQEGFNERQEKFNERQEKFNERQDQFNIIFLDEIRGMKKDIKELTDVVLKQHEGRLKRLEDFMDGFLRKAG